MKVVILAGGYGTRISEETTIIPKPLVEIGEMPILWHIMKIFAYHGFDEFVICCGYKGYLIKKFFLDYFHRASDITVDLTDNSIAVHHAVTEPWKVTLADTGINTMTGGRLQRVRKYLGDERFFVTYGDGVSDVDIKALLTFHKTQKTLATVTAVHQPGRFGALDLSRDGGKVNGFREKSDTDGGLINGGFFVCEPDVLDYIEGDATVWEQEPLRKLVSEEQLSVFRHKGFWQNMDTLRDKHILQSMWEEDPPWRIWE